MTRNRILLAAALIGGFVLISTVAIVGFDNGRAETLQPPGPIQLDSCNGTPPFTTELGLKNPRFTTATRDSQGLVIVYEDDNGDQATYIDPSYRAFGDLGAVTITPAGEVFVTGRPNIDVGSNPPEERNTIFRVDPQSGKLEPWSTVPLDHDPSDQPFGLMGLAVDCLDGTIYATSLTGTTESAENGTIWRIDRLTKEATLLYENLDATSVAVGTSLGQRYLLLGAARSPVVLGVALSNIDERPQVLTEIGGRGRWLSVRVTKFRPAPSSASQIALTAVDFDYSLRTLPDDEDKMIIIEWTPEGYEQVS